MPSASDVTQIKSGCIHLKTRGRTYLLSHFISSHLSLNREDHWGTTDGFATSFILHCPLGLGEVQACPFPDVVFLPLPLSANVRRERRQSRQRQISLHATAISIVACILRSLFRLRFSCNFSFLPGNGSWRQPIRSKLVFQQLRSPCQ